MLAEYAPAPRNFEMMEVWWFNLFWLARCDHGFANKLVKTGVNRRETRSGTTTATATVLRKGLQWHTGGMRAARWAPRSGEEGGGGRGGEGGVIKQGLKQMQWRRNNIKGGGN